MKKTNSILLLTASALCLTACAIKGGTNNDDYDPEGKTVLQIGVVAKGYGYSFAEDLAEAYTTYLSGSMRNAGCP